MISAVALYNFATACNIAYEIDEAKIAAALDKQGMDFVALVHNGKGGADQGDCQAVIAKARANGVQLVIFRGTSVASHFSISELWDDSDVLPIPLGDGIEVMAGFFKPLSTIMGRIFSKLDFGHPVVWVGHSKGGSEVHLVPAFLPREVTFHGVSFGAPRCANDRYWFWCLGRDNFNMVRVEAEGDFAPHHPPTGPFVKPLIPWIAITKDGIEDMSKDIDSPFVIMSPESIAKHSIDGSYMKSIFSKMPDADWAARQETIQRPSVEVPE